MSHGERTSVDLKIKELRKARKVTQQDFASRLSVDVKTVSNWERGETTMSAEQLWNCAVALDSDPNTILGWPSAEPEAHDPVQSQLLHAYDSLNEEGREVAVNVVSGLAGTYPQEPPEVQAESA